MASMSVIKDKFTTTVGIYLYWFYW